MGPGGIPGTPLDPLMRKAYLNHPPPKKNKRICSESRVYILSFGEERCNMKPRPHGSVCYFIESVTERLKDYYLASYPSKPYENEEN